MPIRPPNPIVVASLGRALLPIELALVLLVWLSPLAGARGQAPNGPESVDSANPPATALRGGVAEPADLVGKVPAGPVIVEEDEQRLIERIAEPTRVEANPRTIVNYLIAPRLGKYGRAPIHIDPVASAFARDGWVWPKEGQEIVGTDGRRQAWQSAAANEEGWLRHEHLQGGYAAAQVELPRAQTLLLEATGHVVVYVNGEPRAGDPYRTGKTATPVRLRQGGNELVFHVAGGELHARVVAPKREVAFDMRDATLPDLVVGESEAVYGAVLLINARLEALSNAQLTTVRPGGRKITASIPTISPLGVRKVVVPIDGALTQDEAEADAVRVQMDLTLPADGDDAPRRIVDTQSFDLAIVRGDQLQTRTFLSDIDGSVQSYAFLPAAEPAPSPVETFAPPGLLVALHRTGVPAIAVLRNLRPTPWAHFLAPTGRRPVGFDWEDWSQLDMLEAIDDVRSRNQFDELRVSLAGSGAGGHGALRVAALLPDRFAALASNSGWLSYHTHGRSVASWARPSPVQALLNRCADVSRTTPLLKNLVTLGVHIQHDAADPEAPLAEARTIRRRLAEFHPDFAYRERVAERESSPIRAIAQGQSPAEFLLSRSTPRREEVDQVDFTTLNPSESSSNQWLEILQQQQQFARTTVSIACDAVERRFVGITANVASVALDVSHLSPGAQVTVQLDGQLLEGLPWPQEAPLRLTLKQRDGRWELLRRSNARQKSPQRYGGFRTAWNNRVALVYGTRGDEEENAWSLAKARFDADSFLVRGGGAVDVVADVEFTPSKFADRNVILYGNVDTNGAWGGLLSTSPVQVRSGRVSVGLRPELGDDLAVLLIRPRRDSDRAVVAAVSGTGVAGMRATDRLPYFVSGVTLPDLMIYSTGALDEGTSAFRAAGFFGLDWSVDHGEIAWRDAAL